MLNKTKSLLEKKLVMVIFVATIMAIGFLVRTYKIHNPIADWHSWRQADTAAVSRNFIKDGFNPFYPQYDALNPLNETGQPNPHRYFFAEFPLYNILTYFVYLKFGVHEEYARLISIFFATITIPFLYFLVSEYSSKRVAIISAIVFAILPYNIYYGRVIMADPMYICFSVATLYFVSKWLSKDSILFMTLAGISGAIAVLAKPYALVLIIPVLYLFYKKWGIKTVSKAAVYAFLLLVAVPFALWRHHINQYPEGMFGTTWLYNQGNIRFTGAY